MPFPRSSFVTTATGITLVFATSIIGYVLSRQDRSLSSARSRAGEDLSSEDSISAHKDQSEMRKPKTARFGIPIVGGLKTFVVCAYGKDEDSILGGWVSASRNAGSVVVMVSPSEVTRLRQDPEGVFDLVVVEEGEDVDVDMLNGILEQLKLGRQVKVVFQRNAPSAANKRALIFAGFVEVAVSTENERVLIGQRPKWECGASASFRLPIRTPEENLSTSAAVSLPMKGMGDVANGVGSTPPAGKKTWKLVMDEEDDGGAFEGDAGADDDLVDEDSLLESSAPVKRNSELDSDACATKRRACKDCSCGRAQGDGDGMPRTVISVADVDDALTSACGNCSRGDAFRCGGCPFLGKPAFEKGQEKAIMLSDLDAQQDD